MRWAGLGRTDSLVIHDLEPTPHIDAATGHDGVSTAQAHLDVLRESGFRRLQEMRADGQSIGQRMGPVGHSVSRSFVSLTVC